MPFITEEIWQQLNPRKDGESIMVSMMPEIHGYDEALLQDFELVKEAVQNIRTVRKNHNIAMKEAIELKVMAGEDGYVERFNAVVSKLTNLSSVTAVTEKPGSAAGFMVKSSEFFVPLASTIDPQEELAKLKAELQYAEGFLASVMKKLGNERFVASAPANVVALEQQKKADAEAKIAVLKDRIAELQ